MKYFLLIFSLIVTILKADNFAFIASGSNNYINYRHQADVCHAYQLLLKKGMKPENIIVMAYDDIANNRKNPIKGTLYNYPSSEEQKQPVNVYEGCQIDYWGRAVNPKNFIAILKGQKDKLKNPDFHNGRVLETTQNDNIFLYFSDHGGPGLISFPPKLFVSQMLFKSKIVKAFNWMFENNKYNKLTFYLESCYSGSMFTTLPNDKNVYAVSASDTTQPSFAAYCPPEDIVGETAINACLGDEFSVNWIFNTEENDINSLTLEEQYQDVAKLTTKSTVLQWGDQSFTDNTLNEFMSASSQDNINSSGFLDKLSSIFGQFNLGQQKLRSQQKVANSEIEEFYYMSNYKRDPTYENYFELQQYLLRYQSLKKAFDQFEEKYGVYYQLYDNSEDLPPTTNENCYNHLIFEIETQYGRLNYYGLKRLDCVYKFCYYIDFNTDYIDFTQVQIE